MEEGSISLFVLIWIGVAVLWSLRLAYRKRGAGAERVDQNMCPVPVCPADFVNP